MVWRKQVGQGFAGPAVAGNRVILFHRLGREEVVDALDAGTGALQWHHAYPTAYRDDFGFDEGPRAVPVVVNNRVYTFGAEGMLSALDLATQLGEVLVGQPADVQAEIIRINTDARPLALQVALLVPLLAALAGLVNAFRMLRLPEPEPSGSAEGMAFG